MTDFKINVQTNRASDDELFSGASSEGVTLAFKKIKLVNELTLDYEAEENENGTTSKIIKECGHPVHQDLKDRFAALAVHLMLSTETVDDNDELLIDGFLHHPMLEKMTVTSISFGGTEYEGVTLTGRRKLKHKRILNLNAPYIKFNDESGTGYPYENNLFSDVMRLLEEVKLYVGGKYGEGKQLDLFDEQVEAGFAENSESED